MRAPNSGVAGGRPNGATKVMSTVQYSGGDACDGRTDGRSQFHFLSMYPPPPACTGAACTACTASSLSTALLAFHHECLKRRPKEEDGEERVRERRRRSRGARTMTASDAISSSGQPDAAGPATLPLARLPSVSQSVRRPIGRRWLIVISRLTTDDGDDDGCKVWPFSHSVRPPCRPSVFRPPSLSLSLPRK